MYIFTNAISLFMRYTSLYLWTRWITNIKSEKVEGIYSGVIFESTITILIYLLLHVFYVLFFYFFYSFAMVFLVFHQLLHVFNVVPLACCFFHLFQNRLFNTPVWSFVCLFDVFLRPVCCSSRCFFDLLFFLTIIGFISPLQKDLHKPVLLIFYFKYIFLTWSFKLAISKYLSLNLSVDSISICLSWNLSMGSLIYV